MTEEMIVKEGLELAEKEAREKAVQEVKKIAQKTLERIEEIDKEISTAKDEVKKLEDQKKILKMDIDDLREGKLDRISERQEKDPEAKKISVVLIIKEKTIIREVSPWYWPYTVIWQQPYVPAIPVFTTPVIYGDNSGLNNNCLLADGSVFNASYAGGTINCSVAKDATVGTYKVSDHVVHLR